jgi:hypothetical protein
MGCKTMSRDQYPPGGSDNSGFVPPQGADRPEWPKRLRALTADELDRLTIDRDGRFYWDGKAVTHPDRPPTAKAGPAPAVTTSGQGPEREAIDMLDRTANEIVDRKVSADEPAMPVEATPPEDAMPVDEPATLVVENAPAAEPKPLAAVVPETEVAPAPKSGGIRLVEPLDFGRRTAGQEKVRLVLSPWLSFAAVLTTIALFAGAIGIAANGFVAAHDWSCRVGWIKSYCPPKPLLHPGLSARIAD